MSNGDGIGVSTPMPCVHKAQTPVASGPSTFAPLQPLPVPAAPAPAKAPTTKGHAGIQHVGEDTGK